MSAHRQPSSRGPTAIAAYLVNDQDRLTAMLDEARELAEWGYGEAARLGFSRFARDFERHLRLEKNGVSPSLPERYAATLTADHDRLRALVADTCAILDAAGRARSVTALDRVASAHRRHCTTRRRLLHTEIQ
jgi:hypothetical protein